MSHVSGDERIANPLSAEDFQALRQIRDSKSGKYSAATNAEQQAMEGLLRIGLVVGKRMSGLAIYIDGDHHSAPSVEWENTKLTKHGERVYKRAYPRYLNELAGITRLSAFVATVRCLPLWFQALVGIATLLSPIGWLI